MIISIIVGIFFIFQSVPVFSQEQNSLDQNISIHQKYSSGKTVLNYCQTKEVYDFLCTQGASLHLEAYLYFATHGLLSFLIKNKNQKI